MMNLYLPTWCRYCNLKLLKCYWKREQHYITSNSSISSSVLDSRLLFVTYGNIRMLYVTVFTKVQSAFCHIIRL